MYYLYRCRWCLYYGSKTVQKAKKIKKIFYDEMLEMASLGSKVMQPTSVQDAKLNKIDIQVKSSFVQSLEL